MLLPDIPGWEPLYRGAGRAEVRGLRRGGRRAPCDEMGLAAGQERQMRDDQHSL